tara:strand:- start:4193 stop:4432 length:240 start_codon:yes stop_codon:yes gene_type:complete
LSPSPQSGWKQTAAIIASLVGLATLHGLVVVPLTMGRVHAAIDTKIEAHGTRPHTGAVATTQWADLIHRLERIEDAVKK